MTPQMRAYRDLRDRIAALRTSTATTETQKRRRRRKILTMEWLSIASWKALPARTQLRIKRWEQRRFGREASRIMRTLYPSEAFDQAWHASMPALRMARR